MNNKVLDEVYFSVDGEFDGPHPPRHSLLSFGAVAFTLRKGILGEFEVNLETLPGATMHPRTKTEFWDRFPDMYEATRQDTKSPPEAMEMFRDFYKEHAKDRSGVLIEYPGPSDFFWIYWYFMEFLGECPFGHSGQLGMKSYAAAALKQPLRHSTKRNMPKRWFASKLPHTHLAIDDAREQAHLAIRMMCEHLEVPLPRL